MSLLRELFGPSKAEVWNQLAAEIGGQHVVGHFFWGGEKVQACVKDWIITLDTYTVSTGKSSVTYTRLRAPYVNPEGFRFTIYRAGLFSALGKFFGMLDIEVGVPEFDRDFIIKVSEPTAPNIRAVRALFANERVRELITAQPAIYLTVKDDEGYFKQHFPAGVDELWFQVVGVIKDTDRLKSLFDLFGETLNHLCHLGSAYENSVELFIRALEAPGGEIRDGNTLLWDGNKPRRDAAEGLGKLRDPAAVPVLMSVLEDDDVVLRAKAVSALADIGDRRAVRALIRLLGSPLGLGAADALRRFGENELVNAFVKTLQGDSSGFGYLKQCDRPEVITALLGALDATDASVVHVAEALAFLGVIEALPKLRSRSRDLSFANEQLESAWHEAIAKLEAHAALPRPVDAAAHTTQTLPRSAEASSQSTDTLPRATDDKSD